MSNYSHQPARSGFKTLRRQTRGRDSYEIMFGGAEAGPPPLGIFNLTAFDIDWGKKFRQGLAKSTTDVQVVQEEHSLSIPAFTLSNS